MSRLPPRHVLIETGFSPLYSSNISRPLFKIAPSGGTALRDAILEGIKKVETLSRFLGVTNQGEEWKLGIVVVSDCWDTSSRTSGEEMIRTIRGVDRRGPAGNWGLTIVCVKPEGRSLLDSHIESFRRLVSSLPVFILPTPQPLLSQQLLSLRDQLHLSSPSCALLLLLDISYSVSYFREVGRAVEALITTLPGEMLISVLCFNEKVMTLGHAQFANKEERGSLPEDEITLEELEARARCGSFKKCQTACEGCRLS